MEVLGFLGVFCYVLQLGFHLVNTIENKENLLVLSVFL